ncbi:leucyl aminopeptidase, partial [Extibacter sp. GGCC_0201]|nr:leucyl aminopeptidase [Extibacter sp. GGCC_0201]
EQMQEINKALYEDILEEQYGHSYADPAYAVKQLGEEYGQLLSLLYTELRGGIPFAFENRLDYLTIQNELFI